MSSQQMCSCYGDSDPLLCAPCPPRIVGYFEFYEFANGLNLTECEINTIAVNCNIDNDTITTSAATTATESTQVTGSATTGSLTSVSTISSEKSTLFPSTTPVTPASNEAAIVGVVVAAVGAVLLVLGLVFLRRKRKRRRELKDAEFRAKGTEGANQTSANIHDATDVELTRLKEVTRTDSRSEIRDTTFSSGGQNEEKCTGLPENSTATNGKIPGAYTFKTSDTSPGRAGDSPDKNMNCTEQTPKQEENDNSTFEETKREENGETKEISLSNDQIESQPFEKTKVSNETTALDVEKVPTPNNNTHTEVTRL